MIDFARFLYQQFGLEPHAELSTRPEQRLGTDEQWDHAEGALEEALKRHGMDYVISPGEGTFYAPKIDLHMSDSLGRSWQMGTIQVDYHMPRQFGLTYMGADNREHSPIVIHRALLGSLERFIGILIEHYGGAFPLWLAPIQVRIIPVGEDHRHDARKVAEVLREHGFRVDVDDRDETVGKRIRDAEVEKIPKTIVYGDRESPDSLSIRDRGGEQDQKSLMDFVAELATLES
jgi:threonyl-tRNA synthetase